jgi:hypothetical protein
VIRPFGEVRSTGPPGRSPPISPANTHSGSRSARQVSVLPPGRLSLPRQLFL